MQQGRSEFAILSEAVLHSKLNAIQSLNQNERKIVKTALKKMSTVKKNHYNINDVHPEILKLVDKLKKEGQPLTKPGMIKSVVKKFLTH